MFAEQQGIRLIGVDRPGIGSSTPHQYENVLAFAADMQTMADVLGVGKMAVVGLSGGGPYALACAAAMPDRVIAAGVLGGSRRPSDPTRSAVGWSRSARWPRRSSRSPGRHCNWLRSP